MTSRANIPSHSNTLCGDSCRFCFPSSTVLPGLSSLNGHPGSGLQPPYPPHHSEPRALLPSAQVPKPLRGILKNNRSLSSEGQTRGDSSDGTGASNQLPRSHHRQRSGSTAAPSSRAYSPAASRDGGDDVCFGCGRSTSVLPPLTTEQELAHWRNRLEILQGQHSEIREEEKKLRAKREGISDDIKVVRDRLMQLQFSQWRGEPDDRAKSRSGDAPSALPALPAQNKTSERGLEDYSCEVYNDRERRGRSARAHSRDDWERTKSASRERLRPENCSTRDERSRSRTRVREERERNERGRNASRERTSAGSSNSRDERSRSHNRTREDRDRNERGR